MSKNAYLFALSAAASAAVAAAPETAAAVCGCTLADIKATVTKTQGPETFVYKGSPSAGYDAQLVQDTMYGFQSDTAPQVWFDYELNGAGTYTTTATVCRLSYTGTSIGCASAATQTATSTGFLHKEMSVPVNGLYGATKTIWDLVRMRVVSPYSVFRPTGIPIVAPACW